MSMNVFAQGQESLEDRIERTADLLCYKFWSLHLSLQSTIKTDKTRFPTRTRAKSVL